MTDEGHKQRRRADARRLLDVIGIMGLCLLTLTACATYQAAKTDIADTLSAIGLGTGTTGQGGFNTYDGMNR